MNAQERHAAVALPHLALDDQDVCAHRVAELLNVQLPTARTVMPVYNKLGWTNPTHTQTTHNLGVALHSTHRLTRQFWQDYDELHLTLSMELEDHDKELYDKSVAARHRIPLDEVYLPARQKHAVTYLGGAALLAERRDITRYGKWLGGLEGWKALITIQAHINSNHPNPRPMQPPLFRA